MEKVLLEAWRSMRETEPNASFRVVVVDSRPLNEGKFLLALHIMPEPYGILTPA